MNKGKDLFKTYIVDMYEDNDTKRQEKMKGILMGIHQGKINFDKKMQLDDDAEKTEIKLNSKDVKMLKDIYAELLNESHSSLAELTSVVTIVVAVVAALISLANTISVFVNSDSCVLSVVLGLITILLFGIVRYSFVNLSKIQKICNENTYFRNQKIYYIMLEHDMEEGNKAGRELKDIKK